MLTQGSELIAKSSEAFLAGVALAVGGETAAAATAIGITAHAAVWFGNQVVGGFIDSYFIGSDAASMAAAEQQVLSHYQRDSYTPPAPATALPSNVQQQLDSIKPGDTLPNFNGSDAVPTQPQPLVSWNGLDSAPFATTPEEAWEGVGVHDLSKNESSIQLATPYSGPVTGLKDQYVNITPDNVNITSQMPGSFIKTGAGNDAINVSAMGGSNVLDGNTGSNFLVGASGTDGGTDTFFTDARSNEVVWNTLANFHTGDSATLWGFVPGTSSWTWDGISGAAGYTGATLRADVHGTGTTDASITFAGLSMAQAQGLQISTGTAGGVPYLYVHNPGV